ncbi:MAG: formimidoylglutamase [Bacteroidales bacterium]|nr:formimidoylglutamase [Bacteroidales bacterium]
MELITYLQPIKREAIDFLEGDFGVCLGSKTATYWEGEAFPDLNNVSLAMIGVCEDRGTVDNSGCALAPDAIRRKLYRLSVPCDDMTLADLGNIVPGRTTEDTLFAVTDVVYQLLHRNVTVIILGGGQDITLAQYKAYERLGRVVNITAIDSRFDLENSEQVTSQSYLSHIVRQDPNFLFNFTNIGYQSYFVDRQMVMLLDDLQFDAYRLGVIKDNMRRAETLIRATDLLTVDLGAVRQSDCPAVGNPSPHGFYGEDLCLLTRYAGMSDKLTSIGFYELNPRYDNRYQSAQMVAHSLWYFIEGFFHRYHDFPYRDPENYRRYLVTLNPTEITYDSDQSSIGKDAFHADLRCTEIVFIKSKKSSRWWMEVPCEMDDQRERYAHHLLVPCTKEEYDEAVEGRLPDLWMKYYSRVNSL